MGNKKIHFPVDRYRTTCGLDPDRYQITANINHVTCGNCVRILNISEKARKETTEALVSEG